MTSPIPCANCGTNFMRQDKKPEAPRLCNSCLRPTAKKPDGITILIELDKKTYAEIEEKAISLNKSFGEYFVDLHRESDSHKASLEILNKHFDKPEKKYKEPKK
jgi:hypothetical protein